MLSLGKEKQRREQGYSEVAAAVAKPSAIVSIEGAFPKVVRTLLKYKIDATMNRLLNM